MGKEQELAVSAGGVVAGVVNTDPYTFMHDSYFGNGGYYSANYLVKHPRESAENYVNRQRVAYFLNYVKPCINAAVNPLFDDPPARTSALDDAYWTAFLKNVDGKNTSMDTFMKKAAKQAKIYGAMFIVVENYKDLPANKAQALAERKYPYLYTVKPQDVKEYALDKYGNLTLIRYDITYTEVVNMSKSDITESWTWTKEMWQVTRKGGTESGINRAGVVPVVPLLGAAVEDDMGDRLKPFSDFYQIARVNLAIYNACSELRERNRNQAFSVLVYQMSSDDSNPDNYASINIGTNNMLLYAGNNAPAFITPDNGPSEMLHTELKMLIEEIYRMADRAGVTGVQSQQSGIAKEWDNKTMMQSLSDFAQNCEETEQQIAVIFGNYIGKELGVNVQYSRNFGVVDISSELDKITDALSWAVGGKFDTAVKKKAAKMLLSDMDDEEIQAVIDDIDQQAVDANHAEPTNNAGDDGGVE